MKILSKADAGGPLDGRKTIYSVEIGEKEYVDVMRCEESGLIYVMQAEDGGEIYDEKGETVNRHFDKSEVIALVIEWVKDHEEKQQIGCPYQSKRKRRRGRKK